MDRLDLFPDSTRIQNDRLTIAGLDLSTLADQYGTPLYLYDRATLDHAVDVYQDSLSRYPAPSGITYAGKAYLNGTLARWAQERGLWVDVTGQAEIAIAAQAGVRPAQLLVHGVNKSSQDLQAAIRSAGTIVVDNLSELNRLIELAHQNELPNLWLRLQPGQAVETHVYTQTGHTESKFGMAPKEISQAAELCRKHNLPLKGLHFHQGSQFSDPAPIGNAIQLALELAKAIGFAHQWFLSPGGGWGVSYHESELPHPSIETYMEFILAQLTAGCHRYRLPLPHLQVEPGRSLIARAGVALYRIGTIKHSDRRTWLLVDGGLADNPRPALYGVKYSALPVSSPERDHLQRVWIAGPYCESGDVLIEDLPFPEVEEGEVIAIPVSGAYQLSMASNYNGALRPAALMLANQETYVMQSRENQQDLWKREPKSI